MIHRYDASVLTDTDLDLVSDYDSEEAIREHEHISEIEQELKEENE